MSEKAVVRQTVRTVSHRALETYRGRQAQATRAFRMDPFAFIARLKVWDPVALAFADFAYWPHQEELLAAWMDLDELTRSGRAHPELARLRFRNVLGEKSRQMGDTVIVAAGMLWAITHHDAPLLMQHQDLQEVADSGPTWDSFFGKIKTMWMSQPWEIGKAQLHFTGGNNPQVRNEAHQARYIVGEGQTADPGRGGRYAGAFLDEAARLRFDLQAQAALSRACPDGRLMLSTPQGRGNVYYRIRTERPEGWVIVDHHWSKHPDYSAGMHVAAFRADPRTGEPAGQAPQPKDQLKLALACRSCAGILQGRPWTSEKPYVAHRYPGKLTSPWYDKAVIELTDEQVAEELDIDYTASLTARVYTEFDEREHVVDRIDYDRQLPLEFSFDYGWDVTAVGIWQDAPYELRKIGEVEFTEALPADVAAGILATLAKLGVTKAEMQRTLRTAWLCVGDPAGEGTQLNSGESLTTDYYRAGFSISNPGQQRVVTTIKALKRLLIGRPKRIRYSRAGCPLTILHMQENRWPTDAQGNRRVGATKPLDDEHNHMCRADAYYATYKFPPPNDVEARPDPPSVGGAPWTDAFAGDVGSGITLGMDL